MRDTASVERGSTIPVVGVLIAFYGVVQIFFIFLAFAELRILNLLFILFWVPLVITGAYIILGFGLQDRRLWAYLGTLIFITLMLLVYIGTIILIDNPLYDATAILHVIIHISILTYLAWHGREFIVWQAQWGIVESGWNENERV